MPPECGRGERAGTIQTGNLPSESAQGTYGAENTPLKVGDSLYVCPPKNMVLSLDPATGKQRWRFDPRISDDAIPHTAACRGVAYYDVPDAPAPPPCARPLIFGPPDPPLLALPAAPGRPRQHFAAHATVDTPNG